MADAAVAAVMEKETLSGLLDRLLPLADIKKKSRLVSVFEGREELNAFEEEIKKLQELLIYDDEKAQDFAADILLGRITLCAAQTRLRVEKNFASVIKLKSALNLDARTADTLVNAYASPSSPMFFDDEMTAALNEAGPADSGDGYKRALTAAGMLKDKARALDQISPAQNKKNLDEIAGEFSLGRKLKNDIQNVYADNIYADIKKRFYDIFNALEKENPDKELNSVLAAKVMLCVLGEQDARDISVLGRELKYPILEEDLTAIGMRYLRTKSVKEIVATIDALLKRLPFCSAKEENLGLAVKVLLDGTRESLDSAQTEAQSLKDQSAFRAGLNKHECFSGFVFDLAPQFAGKITLEELLEKYNALLKDLPFCSCESENWDTACRLLLGRISKEEAISQAQYGKDLRAQTLVHGLAPECLKKYLGTQSPEEVTKYIERSLKPYNFWKNDEAKHLYAQRTIVSELNGLWGREATKFVLNALEDGETPEGIETMFTLFKPRTIAKMDFKELEKTYKEDFKKYV